MGAAPAGRDAHSPFLSPDPILKASAPQELDGYTYAADNPATQADPTGLLLPPHGGSCDPSQYGCPGYHKPGRGGSSGSSGSSSPGQLPISPHVSVAASNPRAPQFLQAWRWALRAYGSGGGASQEYSRWVGICNNSPYVYLCTPDMKAEFPALQPIVGNSSGFSGQAFMQGYKLLILTGVVRSLANPASMVGATLDQIRALVPKGWISGPLGKGTGIKFQAPGRVPGSRGLVEYNEGAPEVGDPLHAGPYLKVKIGGLEYRAAAEGNPVIEDPEIPSVVIGRQGSTGPVDVSDEIDFGGGDAAG